MTHEYDDIINLPHHISKVHPPMTMLQRAAQFAPFAALTGYGTAIQETARLTDNKVELDDASLMLLNQKLSLLRNHLKEKPIITVTFFQPDERKSGGTYKSYTGCLRDIDDFQQTLVMKDGVKIPFLSILDLISTNLMDIQDE